MASPISQTQPPTTNWNEAGFPVRVDFQPIGLLVALTYPAGTIIYTRGDSINWNPVAY